MLTILERRKLKLQHFSDFSRVLQLVLQQSWGSGTNFSDFQPFALMQPPVLLRTPACCRNREGLGVPVAEGQSCPPFPRVGMKVGTGHMPSSQKPFSAHISG